MTAYVRKMFVYFFFEFSRRAEKEQTLKPVRSERVGWATNHFLIREYDKKNCQVALTRHFENTNISWFSQNIFSGGFDQRDRNFSNSLTRFNHTKISLLFSAFRGSGLENNLKKNVLKKACRRIDVKRVRFGSHRIPIFQRVFIERSLIKSAD